MVDVIHVEDDRSVAMDYALRFRVEGLCVLRGEGELGEKAVFFEFVEDGDVEEVDFELMSVGADVDLGGLGLEEGFETRGDLISLER